MRYWETAPPPKEVKPIFAQTKNSRLTVKGSPSVIGSLWTESSRGNREGAWAVLLQFAPAMLNRRGPRIRRELYVHLVPVGQEEGRDHDDTIRRLRLEMVHIGTENEKFQAENKKYRVEKEKLSTSGR
jgi:hypothetical protein